MIYVVAALIIIAIALEVRMSQQFEDLKAAVERQETVTESAVTLIKNIAEKLNASKDNPDQIEQLAAQLNHNADALAAAVQANTPAEQQPASEPTETSGAPTEG